MTLRFTTEVCTWSKWLISHYCTIEEKWQCLGSNIYILLVAPFARGLDPLFDPFCIWGNEVTMTINQVKKLRKNVRIKKLATKDNKLFFCTMKKTSVSYRMVLIYIPTIFFPYAHNFNTEKLYLGLSLYSVFSEAVHRWLFIKPPVWSRGKKGFCTTLTL